MRWSAAIIRSACASASLSIAATIIASQALITGTFSLTRQAIQLGFFPRLTVRHTSAEREGQIYLPLVNRMLAIGAIACAMAGACAGLAAFPPDKLARVVQVNRLDLAPLAARLLALREARP